MKEDGQFFAEVSAEYGLVVSPEMVLHRRLVVYGKASCDESDAPWEGFPRNPSVPEYHVPIELSESRSTRVSTFFLSRVEMGKGKGGRGVG